MARYESETTGDYLDYWTFVPENPVEGLPLIVFLHGDGNRANPESLESDSFARAVEDAYGSAFPFISISPNTRLYSWTEGSIDDTLMELIELIKADFACDRVILCGHSRGAIGTWALLSQYGDYFSAAVPVSCGSDMQLDYSMLAKVPIMGFSGNIGQDGTHYGPAMAGIVRSVNEAGGSAEVHTLMGEDHAGALYAALSPETFEWMLAQ